MKIFISLFALLAFTGCASSSRVDVLTDQVKLQGIQIKELQNHEQKEELQIISLYSRIAGLEGKIEDQKTTINSIQADVQNLSSKFDFKFKDQIMK